MNTFLRFTTAASLAASTLVGAIAHAEDGEIDDRRYIGVLGSYMEPDTDARADILQYEDGYGVHLLLGKQKSEKINTEFSLSYNVLEGDRNGVFNAHDWQLQLGYDWLYFFDREGWQPFGIIGGSLTHEEREPDDHAHASLNAGLGLLKQLNEHGTAFRIEARYVYHFDDESICAPAGGCAMSSNDNPGDIRVAVGFQTPLTAKPAELPPPPPPPPPPADSDGDGVVDGVDECPNTQKGLKVDRVGCAVKQVFELEGVNFEFDKATLMVNAKSILDQAAATLEGQPSLKVEIAGHTDSQGADSYNQDLSQRRANTVKDYLVNKGANGDNLTAVGYGEAEPVSSNDTPEGREENRRVELRILEQ
ncbi:MAG: OmpA family protein [Nevskiales bacterium]